MGNSASDIISRVSGAGHAEMLKQVSQDIELLQDSRLVFSASKLTLRTDLNNYSVPGMEEKKDKKDPITTEDEQSLICSQDYPSSAKERRDQVINNLIVDIARTTETDIATSEVTKRLQAFCRIFEAILRSDEIKKKKAKQDSKGENNELNLPPAAKSAIKFGLSTLLCLVECVAALNPTIYELVVSDTNRILVEMGPLSIVSSDSTINQAFSDIGSFFEKVIKGGISTITEEAALHSFIPLFRLGLCTGSLQFFTNFISRLLSLKEPNKSLLHALYPALQQFGTLAPRSNLVFWDLKKKSDKIKVSNENLTVNSSLSEVGNVFSSLVISSDKFYFEITAKKFTDNSYFGICDANYTNTSA